MTRWLLAFALTQFVEVPVYLRAGASGRTAFLASALTHPVVWFGFPLLREVGLGYWGMVAVAEVFAVGAEALWLRAQGIRRPLAWSVVANATSVLVGLLLRELFGVP
ncbi:hypothetical protein P2318_30905 [Myxococcaceae bacterium GXIMD 01537]